MPQLQLPGLLGRRPDRHARRPAAAGDHAVAPCLVESYLHQIRIPTLLAQGEDDTLFQLHEAVATYEGLRQQGTPVKMIWQSWGHSQSTPVPGELGDGPGGYAAFDARGAPPTRGRRSSSGSPTTSRTIPPRRRWTSPSSGPGSATRGTPHRPTGARRNTQSGPLRTWSSPAPTRSSANPRRCAAGRRRSPLRAPEHPRATARSPRWR